MPTDSTTENEPPADEDEERQQNALTKGYLGIEDKLFKTVGRFSGGIAPVVPFRQRVFRRMAVKSLENYHKVAKGDAIGLVAEPGQSLSLVPVKWKAPEECDEGEKSGWKAKGMDKVWEAGSEGRVVDYLGRTPIVLLEHDSHIEAGWLKSRIGEAIELDRYDPVFANAQINAVFEIPPTAGSDNAGAVSGGAVAPDGGQQQSRFKGLEIEEPGRWVGDSLINLSSEDGYDGMRISHRKANEWMSETTTTQEMQMQEDRGYLRGKMAAGTGPSITKLLLICAAIILGTLAIIYLGPMILGEASGGTGGGGINPLSVTMAMLGV